MRILKDFSNLSQQLCLKEKFQFYCGNFICASHFTVVNNKQVDSIKLNYITQSKQLSKIYKVQQNPHKISIDLVYGKSQLAPSWQKISHFIKAVHFYFYRPLEVFVLIPIFEEFFVGPFYIISIIACFNGLAFIANPLQLKY